MYDKKVSKFLSYILRHKPDAINLKVDKSGWADIEELIKCTNRHLTKSKLKQNLTRELIEAAVANNNKNRFKISDDGRRIRASQGHSFDVDLGLEPVKPPDILYHGTASAFLDSIMVQGLTPMKRQHVHLSYDRDTAFGVGGRHGKSIILIVNAEGMYEDGFNFYLSDNGVWLTDEVPREYLVIG